MLQQYVAVPYTTSEMDLSFVRLTKLAYSDLEYTNQYYIESVKILRIISVISEIRG